MTALKALPPNHLVDAIGFASRAADRAPRPAAIEIQELVVQAYMIWASWSTTGGEGTARNAEVDRERDRHRDLQNQSVASRWQRCFTWRLQPLPGDQGPLVQERGHLLPGRRHVHGRQRRRLRRLRGPARAGSTTSPASASRCLWLLPFQPSPERDNGYDITDYYGVDPRYGTLGDFVEFTHQAKQRGIRVIIDLVVNHTSRPAPVVPGGAQRARTRSTATGTSGRRSGRRTPTRAWSSPACRRRPGPTTPKPARTTSTASTTSSPTSTCENPQVQEEIRKIMGFWLRARRVRLSRRCGAVRHRDQGRRQEARRALRLRCATCASSCSGARGDAIMLAEANVVPTEQRELLRRRGDRLHMMFNFWVNQHLFYALASGDARPLAKALEQTRKRPAHGAVGELPAQPRRARPRPAHRRAARSMVFEEFGPEQDDAALRSRHPPAARPDARGDRAPPRARVQPAVHAAGHAGASATATRSAWATTCGSRSATAVRTPMQWSTEPHGGFTRAEKPVLPVIDDGPYGYRQGQRGRCSDAIRARCSTGPSG